MSHSAKCAYNNESYVCQCTDGYKGDGKNNCTGIWLSPNHFNLQIFLFVSCILSSKMKIIYLDVDECTQNPGVCDINANCTNTEGSYSCECLKGYTGDGEHNCSGNAYSYTLP